MSQIVPPRVGRRGYRKSASADEAGSRNNANGTNRSSGINNPLITEDQLDVALQISSALMYLHEKNIMFRDLKPQNLLVNKDGVLKLADFGLARAFCPPIRPLTQEVVTLWYRPPEILLGSQTYAPPMDVWAIGTIFVEMVTKRPLFPGDSEIDEIYKKIKTMSVLYIN